jgi:2,3-bisphosphoglycerate-independent phosphoglycerate mutase
MEASRPILAGHPVNAARRAAHHSPATQIWLWGQGRALTLTTYGELYGLSGGVISAVDLVRGIGLLAGLEAPLVPGATGFLDTNYEGKVTAAIDILNRHDFVYVHVEAPDECGHLGRPDLKKQAIEEFDQRIVRPIWEHLERRGEPYRLLIAMDHRTPVAIKSHTPEPVPLLRVDGPVGALKGERAFDEDVNGGRAEVLAHEWVQQFLGRSA